MKQYGFYIDSSKCTGCKTCQLACKDYRDLDVKRNYRRVYEYAGAALFRMEIHGFKMMCSLTIYLSPVTTVQTQRVSKFVHLVRCINAKKMALLS